MHDLRHTWAALAPSIGAHPKVVQDRLGHANVSSYSHLARTLHDDAPETAAKAHARGR